MDNTASAIGDPLDATVWCAEMAAASLAVFALLNPAVESIPQTVRRSMDQGVNLFAGRTVDAQALAIGPRLMPIQHSDRLTAAIAAQSAEQPWGLFIASRLPIAPLLERLRRRIDVTADGRDLMLRFWDSRILLSLHRVTAPATRSRLFAFGEQALVPDRRGGSCMLALTCPDEDPVAAPLALDRTDLDALAEAARPDALLALLRQDDPNALDDVAVDERHALAASQWAECQRRGLRSPRDQALALRLAIAHGPQWWEDASWQPMLRQAAHVTLRKAYAAHLENEEADENA